jgi:hypothetical protein
MCQPLFQNVGLTINLDRTITQDVALLEKAIEGAPLGDPSDAGAKFIVTRDDDLLTLQSRLELKFSRRANC